MNDKISSTLISRAIDKSISLGINVCIAIVDDGAILKTFHRMDNSFKGSVDVAISKARTSALFPLSTEDFGTLVRDEQLTGIELTNQGLVAFPGGIPIMRDGIQLGAIGISGGSAIQDTEIAHYALTDITE